MIRLLSLFLSLWLATAQAHLPLHDLCREGIRRVGALNKRGGVQLAEILDVMRDYGIMIIGESGALRFNGGDKFDAKKYFRDIIDHGQTDEFEHAVFAQISRERELILGLGDESVRKVLVPDWRAQTQQSTSADCLSVTPGKPPSYHLREMKSGPPESWDIAKAVRQLGASREALKKRVPAARLATFEIAVPSHPIESGQVLSDGYRIGSRVDADKAIYELQKETPDGWQTTDVRLRLFSPQ